MAESSIQIVFSSFRRFTFSAPKSSPRKQMRLNPFDDQQARDNVARKFIALTLERHNRDSSLFSCGLFRSLPRFR
jgi:hypothetical protein